MSVLGRFRSDERAAIAVASALIMLSLILVGSIMIDSAIAFIHQRKVQSAVDLAALTAARNLTNAEEIVFAVLADNGFANPETVEIELGNYNADILIPENIRFVANDPNVNAVSVRMVEPAPVIMWQNFFEGTGPRVEASAIAANTGIASFAIGTRLASLEGGILNDVLGGLLGTEIELDIMDYEALLDAKINLIDALDRLAIETELAGATYTDLANLTIGWTDYAYLIEDMLYDGGAAIQAVNAVRSLGEAEDGPTFLIGDLIDIGPLAYVPVGEDGAGLNAQVSALDAIMAAARIADGEHAAVVDLSANLGAVQLTMNLVIGETMQGASWVTVGPTGTTINTAQTRLYVDAAINGVGILAGRVIHVPLYLEVAAGTATLNTVGCGWAPNDGEVEVAARPAVAATWIGDIDEDDLPEFGTTITPVWAQILNILGIIKVDAYANVEMANPDPTMLTFTKAQIDAATIQTVDTHSYLGSTLASLLGNTQLNATVLGFSLLLNKTAVLNALDVLLTGVAATIDAVISDIFHAAGVSIGELDVVVGGLRCDGAALVH